MAVKLSVFGGLMLVCALAFAEEKADCGSAVDAADRLAPTADEHCDYTKTGLNGALHKVFSGKQAPAEVGLTASAPAHSAEKIDSAAAPLIAKGQFNSAPQLQAVRFSLLEAAALKCPQGFVVDSEHYVPAASKTMALTLGYRCL